MSKPSNGDQGWIQIGNFLVAGVLFIAFAAGLRRMLPLTNRRSAVWGPRLIAVFGVGMVGAGVLSADPVDGFPPGTPIGPPTGISWHGMAHFLFGTIAFLALIGACFVLARHFAGTRQTSWAVLNAATGTAFLAAWISVLVLQGARAANVALAVAIAVALVYTSLLAAQQLRQLPATDPEAPRQQVNSPVSNP